MEIGKIMQSLSNSRKADQTQSTVKTAAATDNLNPNALRDALRETLASAPQMTKTASPQQQPADNPAMDLMKLAEDLTSAEESALLKQASLYGAAMCDGFMTRYAQYDDAASQIINNTKTATAAHDPDLEAIKTAAANDPHFMKFASENPDLVKEAVDLGYRQQMAQLEKTAQDEINAGYYDALQEVHKVASDCYKYGAHTINGILQSIS